MHDRDDAGVADNVPGFDYLQRISTAMYRAMLAQGEELNAAWSEMRQGRYDVRDAMRSWAVVTETYYGVLAEVLQGPLQIPRPTWLIIPYSKSRPPAPTFSMRIDAPPEQPGEVDYTEFRAIGDRPAAAAARVYDGAPRRVRTRIEFRLHHDTIVQLPDLSEHLSFIFRKGQGAAPPLAVVILRVTP